MALHILSDEIDRLAHELAAATGEPLEDAVAKAIEERLRRVRPAERSAADRLRRELALKTILEAREMRLRAGVTAPTKAEIEEMLGMEY